MMKPTMVHYTSSSERVTTDQLQGFFEGWPDPPTPETHLRLLRKSDAIGLAIDDEPRERVVGFITAITDDVLAAYVPLLEVLPPYRGRGIGGALVRRMLAHLDGLYMIDVMCDPPLQPFYARLGFRSAQGSSIRNYPHQRGRPG